MKDEIYRDSWGWGTSLHVKAEISRFAKSVCGGVNGLECLGRSVSQ